MLINIYRFIKKCYNNKKNVDNISKTFGYPSEKDYDYLNINKSEYFQNFDKK
jgi:hypothetical protein